ncbi:MAG: DUF1707 domain-containing protein [Sporichthyaceae bacterium]
MSDERDPALRASDGDRDEVADRLRRAHTEGRLTVEEYGERLDAAFAARTLGDLAALTADLPRPDRAPARTGDEPTAGRRPERAGRRSGRLAGAGGSPGPPALRAAWGAWLSVVLVCVAVYAAAGVSGDDFGYFWPVWVAGPWGAVLLARSLRDRR